MEFLVNDLSFHGQFVDIISFKDAISRLMTIRNVVRSYGRELHCHRNMLHANVTPTMALPQAITSFTIDQQRALRSWITQHGPFWDDARNHSSDDYLEFNNQIVTDTAVGEAAWCQLMGIERELVSIIPSNWKITPILVDLVSNDGVQKRVQVGNHWDDVAVESLLKLTPVPIMSWLHLEKLAAIQCTNLTYLEDAFSYLNGTPFTSSAAKRILFILNILDRFKECFDGNGQRTPEGNEIYQNFFTGVKEGGGHGATFTDSSDSEKNSFNKEMTFKHPDDANKSLFCTWHGKIQTPQLRVHFSYPIRANEPLYVAYVGPKLTKR